VQVRRWYILRLATSLCGRVSRTFRRTPKEIDPAAGGWEFYVLLFRVFTTSLPFELREQHLVMRRRLAGAWQYRLPTPDEEADYIASESW